MTLSNRTLLAGISSMTLKNINDIMPKKCNIPGTKNISLIFDNVISNIFKKFEYYEAIQEIKIKENEFKPFDDNISLKLLKDGSLQIIERD